MFKNQILLYTLQRLSQEFVSLFCASLLIFFIGKVTGQLAFRKCLETRQQDSNSSIDIEMATMICSPLKW